MFSTTERRGVVACSMPGCAEARIDARVERARAPWRRAGLLLHRLVQHGARASLILSNSSMQHTPAVGGAGARRLEHARRFVSGRARPLAARRRRRGCRRTCRCRARGRVHVPAAATWRRPGRGASAATRSRRDARRGAVALEARRSTAAAPHGALVSASPSCEHALFTRRAPPCSVGGAQRAARTRRSPCRAPRSPGTTCR